jgi:hypothetical protein
VNHLATKKPVAQLAPHPQAHPGTPALLLRAVEVQKAQQHLARAIVQAHDQLPTPTSLDAVVAHHPLQLHGLAVAGIAQQRQTGFVFIAQWQVQGQVDVPRQAQAVQRLLRRRACIGGRWLARASLASCRA